MLLFAYESEHQDSTSEFTPISQPNNRKIDIYFFLAAIVRLGMESTMKTITLTVVAIASILTFPAHAAKFSCIFYGTGIPASPACSIDSSSSARCERIFPGSVTGTCLGRGNAIACIFHTDPLPSSFEPELSASSRTPFMAAPGLLAGGVAEASAKWLLAGYKESARAPEFDALCTSQN